MPIISPGSARNLATLQTLADVQSLTPKWLRIPAAMRVFGLSRNQIFAGIASGEIRSKHLKQPGAKIGIRLISYESLDAYVERLES